MTEPWQTTLARLDAGQRYSVLCPDGVERLLWGYNSATGDLFVTGWAGDVWMDCSSGQLVATFEMPPGD